MKYKYEVKCERYGDYTVELDTKDDKYNLEIGAGHLEWWDHPTNCGDFDEEEIEMLTRKLGDDLRVTGCEDIWHEDENAYCDWVMSSIKNTVPLSLEGDGNWFEIEVCGEKALLLRYIWDTLFMKAR